MAIFYHLVSLPDFNPNGNDKANITDVNYINRVTLKERMSWALFLKHLLLQVL